MGGMERDVIVFNGIRFIRYPEAKQYARRHYYQPSISYARRTAEGIGLLHQEIYKASFGPIPEGHIIHHKDGDHLNNDPSNLEAIPQSGHARHHALQEHEGRIAHLDAIRPAATAATRTPEHRARQREHGIRAYADKPYYDAVCQQCGKTFQTRSYIGPRTYCNGTCRWRAVHGWPPTR